MFTFEKCKVNILCQSIADNPRVCKMCLRFSVVLSTNYTLHNQQQRYAKVRHACTYAHVHTVFTRTANVKLQLNMHSSYIHCTTTGTYRHGYKGGERRAVAVSHGNQHLSCSSKGPYVSLRGLKMYGNTSEGSRTHWLIREILLLDCSNAIHRISLNLLT